MLTSHLISQDVLASAPLTFTHKSPHLSRRACKCTIDFYSQVSHLSRRACKCTVDFLSQVTANFSHSGGSPLWHGSLFVVQSSCSCEPDTAVTSHEFCALNAHCGLGFAGGAVSAQILQHVLWDWVTLYAFLSYLWPKFLLERAGTGMSSSCSLQQGATLIK